MDKNIKQNPKVTVLMPAFNAERYIEEAIESILKQSFDNFEFLIIDDGSTDKTNNIISSYNDKRIRLIKNDENLKLIKTLNKGLSIATGEYVVRMDADDICLPDRLKNQVKFMDNNPDIGISGCWAKTIGEKNGVKLKKLISPDMIKANLLFESAFIHPTVIIRKSIIKKYNLYYNENYPHSEDRELWARASNFTKLANLNKILLYYRIHRQSISRTYSNEQIQSANKTIIKQLNKLGIHPNSQELKLHRSIIRPENMRKEDFVKQINIWYQKLIQKNKKTKIFSDKSLYNILSIRWFNICYNQSNEGLWAWQIFWQSPFSNYYNTINVIKFLIRCIVKKIP